MYAFVSKVGKTKKKKMVAVVKKKIRGAAVSSAYVYTTLPIPTYSYILALRFSYYCRHGRWLWQRARGARAHPNCRRPCRCVLFVHAVNTRHGRLIYREHIHKENPLKKKRYSFPAQCADKTTTTMNKKQTRAQILLPCIYTNLYTSLLPFVGFSCAVQTQRAKQNALSLQTRAGALGFRIRSLRFVRTSAPFHMCVCECVLQTILKPFGTGSSVCGCVCAYVLVFSPFTNEWHDTWERITIWMSCACAHVPPSRSHKRVLWHGSALYSTFFFYK